MWGLGVVRGIAFSIRFAANRGFVIICERGVDCYFILYWVEEGECFAASGRGGWCFGFEKVILFCGGANPTIFKAR